MAKRTLSLFMVVAALIAFHAPTARAIQSEDIDVPVVHVSKIKKHKATLSWDKIDDADRYIIRLMNTKGTLKRKISTTDTRKTIKKLKAGKTYTVTVRAVVDGTKGPKSDVVEFTTKSNTNDHTDEVQSWDVSIDGMAFMDDTITIGVGDTVTWTNTDSVSHSVTSDVGQELDSGTISVADTYSHTFTEKGTYTYHCMFHPDMTGTIVVQ